MAYGNGTSSVGSDDDLEAGGSNGSGRQLGQFHRRLRRRQGRLGDGGARRPTRRRRRRGRRADSNSRISSTVSRPLSSGASMALSLRAIHGLSASLATSAGHVTSPRNGSTSPAISGSSSSRGSKSSPAQVSGTPSCAALSSPRASWSRPSGGGRTVSSIAGSADEVVTLWPWSCSRHRRRSRRMPSSVSSAEQLATAPNAIATANAARPGVDDSATGGGGEGPVRDQPPSVSLVATVATDSISGPVPAPYVGADRSWRLGRSACGCAERAPALRPRGRRQRRRPR